jgi:predicted amidohydrolase
MRIAVLQPALKPQGARANMVVVRRLVEELAAQAPLDLVVLPEVFDGCFAPAPGVDRSADVRAFLGNLARGCGVHVVGGSVDCPMPAGRPRQACFVVDRQGNQVGRYDKRVLFSHEAERRSPGQGPGVFELDGVRVGVLICGDLWPPEFARELVDAADLLCVPTMTSVPSDTHVEYARVLWTNLALTRAMENGLVVAVSDWAADRHDESVIADGVKTRRTFYTCGAASICDPSHRPDINRIQHTHEGGQAGTLCARIDLATLAEYRKYRRAVGLLPEPGPGVLGRRDS